ncbi:MAG: hypothetical protein AAFW98_09165, partial [Pseudomonadota bacterium]
RGIGSGRPRKQTAADKGGENAPTAASCTEEHLRCASWRRLPQGHAPAVPVKDMNPLQFLGALPGLFRKRMQEDPQGFQKRLRVAELLTPGASAGWSIGETIFGSEKNAPSPGVPQIKAPSPPPVAPAMPPFERTLHPMATVFLKRDYGPPVPQEPVDTSAALAAVEELVSASEQGGQRAGEGLRTGVESGVEGAVTSAHSISDRINSAFAVLEQQAYSTGAATGQALAAGLLSSAPAVRAAASELSTAASSSGSGRLTGDLARSRSTNLQDRSHR